jgi:hypothetical protein
MLYSRVSLMINDIEAFIRSTGKTVLMSDDPLRGLYGYSSEDLSQTWEVHLLRVEDPHNLTQGAPRREALAKLHRTATEGATDSSSLRSSLATEWSELPEHWVNGKLRITLSHPARSRWQLIRTLFSDLNPLTSLDPGL